MQINQINAFLAVAELQSFSLAAERLHITQPAVSKRIRQLEIQVRAELFDRIGKRSMLTPDGEAFKPHAERILQELKILSLRPQSAAGRTFRQPQLRHQPSHRPASAAAGAAALQDRAIRRSTSTCISWIRKMPVRRSPTTSSSWRSSPCRSRPTNGSNCVRSGSTTWSRSWPRPTIPWQTSRNRSGGPAAVHAGHPAVARHLHPQDHRRPVRRSGRTARHRARNQLPRNHQGHGVGQPRLEHFAAVAWSTPAWSPAIALDGPRREAAARHRHPSAAHAVAGLRAR